MIIKLESVPINGACWQVKYNNEKTENVYGIERMKEIIENANEPIRIEPSKGHEQHSELIKLVQDKTR